MSGPNPFDLDKLFNGSLQRLRVEAEYFSRLTDHNPELGRLNETHLVKLLRNYLPPKIGIGTGFIACGGANPRQSPQCDIVLYDALNNAPLYSSDTWSIYPIEMVYGVIEVKTTLNRSMLENAFDKCAKIRAMAKTLDGRPNKSYMRLIPSPKPNSPAQYANYQNGLSPRFFVFGYNGWKRLATLEKNFKEKSKQHKRAHIHGVCNLYDGGSLYIKHIAYKSGKGYFSQAQENGFRYFLINLPVILDSMLVPGRLGLGFDQLHLEHYSFEVE